MKRIDVVVAGLLLTALLAGRADAQWNVSRFRAGSSQAYTTFGLDPAVVASMGFAHVVSMGGRPVQLAAEAGVVAAHLDARDYRARLGVQTSVARWRSLRLTGSASFLSRGTENSIYRGFDFGADITGTLGVYRHRWFAAGEFGKDKAIITHVTHSDWYRTWFYPEAKDGWYLDAGGTFHYGLAAGLSMGATEVVGRFGFRSTEDFNDVTPPMYATLGVGVAF